MAHAARLNLRLQKELKLLLSDPPPGVSLPSLTENDCTTSSLLSSIEARIEGPEGTVYSNGVFAIKIQVPERYPFQPPNVTFVTPIYHPNIDDGGRICLDILNLPPKGAWQPSLNIAIVLTSIGLLLSEPNPDDGLMAEASREYKYNRQAFDQKARSWTEKYAHHGARSNREGAGPTNTSIIMKSHLQIDTGKMGVKPENAVSDNEGARKKPRMISQKLQLKTTAVLEGKNSDDKENKAPARRLSLSSSQRQIQGSSASLLPQHVTTCKQECFLEDSSVALVGNKEKIKLAPENIETIIVSDSEESDDEIERFPRSKLFLMKNQILGKWKNNTCN